jgi:hypothetical protein
MSSSSASSGGDGRERATDVTWFAVAKGDDEDDKDAEDDKGACVLFLCTRRRPRGIPSASGTYTKVGADDGNDADKEDDEDDGGKGSAGSTATITADEPDDGNAADDEDDDDDGGTGSTATIAADDDTAADDEDDDDDGGTDSTATIADDSDKEAMDPNTPCHVGWFPRVAPSITILIFGIISSILSFPPGCANSCRNLRLNLRNRQIQCYMS